MTSATEYMIAERTPDGREVVLPHCGSWYSDRWYGDGDQAVTGDAAVWRAVQRVADAGPGMFTAVTVGTINRPTGLGLVGRVPTAPVPPAGTVIRGSRARRLRARLASVNPVWRVAAALTVATAWLCLVLLTDTGRAMLGAVVDRLL